MNKVYIRVICFSIFISAATGFANDPLPQEREAIEAVYPEIVESFLKPKLKERLEILQKIKERYENYDMSLRDEYGAKDRLDKILAGLNYQIYWTNHLLQEPMFLEPTEISKNMTDPIDNRDPVERYNEITAGAQGGNVKALDYFAETSYFFLQKALNHIVSQEAKAWLEEKKQSDTDIVDSTGTLYSPLEQTYSLQDAFAAGAEWMRNKFAAARQFGTQQWDRAKQFGRTMYPQYVQPVMRRMADPSPQAVESFERMEGLAPMKEDYGIMRNVRQRMRQPVMPQVQQKWQAPQKAIKYFEQDMPY